MKAETLRKYIEKWIEQQKTTNPHTKYELVRIVRTPRAYGTEFVTAIIKCKWGFVLYQAHNGTMSDVWLSIAEFEMMLKSKLAEKPCNLFLNPLNPIDIDLETKT